MKQPKARTSYSKNLLTVAAGNEDDTTKVLTVVRILQDTSAENPFLKTQALRQKVCEKAMEIFPGSNPNDIMRIYTAASNVVIPFLKSGEKQARTDAIIDAIVEKAGNHLTYNKKVKNADGEYEEIEVFDSEVAKAIINAVKVQMGIVTATQRNLIEAQKDGVGDNSKAAQTNLGEMSREQLERLFREKLVKNPELARMMMEKRKQAIQIQDSSRFYENVNE